ncbi:MAG TPA: PhzF family phenazine biosynthesis protein [Candidatus Sulfotelmatobacter sp.]|jgi:PhzF family phenazine biosynthesis protein|nr:PhzF family phenazine biosynthesis protein [Candidatus Sulfotelmatobacter sp.]
MPRLPLYQVDAFANRLFAGNPAAVVPLQEWLPDALLLSIAAENNLAETAFFVKEGDVRRLRWFTPEYEMDLCGHATLASAWVIFQTLEPKARHLDFITLSGPLRVSRQDDESLSLDFPSRPPEPCAIPATLAAALKNTPLACLRSRDLVAVFPDARIVRDMKPDFSQLESLDVHAVIVTASGESGSGVDFVSRFFTLGEIAQEDPVTGSAHCTLVPYWAERLGKTAMNARQLSARGGELQVALAGQRVHIAGRVVPYLEGFITV